MDVCYNIVIDDSIKSFAIKLELYKNIFRALFYRERNLHRRMYPDYVEVHIEISLAVYEVKVC